MKYLLTFFIFLTGCNGQYIVTVIDPLPNQRPFVLQTNNLDKANRFTRNIQCQMTGETVKIGSYEGWKIETNFPVDPIPCEQFAWTYNDPYDN
jgi:hypothetical protein